MLLISIYLRCRWTDIRVSPTRVVFCFIHFILNIWKSDSASCGVCTNHVMFELILNYVVKFTTTWLVCVRACMRARVQQSIPLLLVVIIVFMISLYNFILFLCFIANIDLILHLVSFKIFPIFKKNEKQASFFYFNSFIIITKFRFNFVKKLYC